MSAFQVLSGLFVAFLLLCAMYVAYRYAANVLDKQLPRPVIVAPMPVSMAPTDPPRLWWDELKALQMHVDVQVMAMQGYANSAETAYRNARSSEERARKRERALDAGYDDDEGQPPAQPVMPIPAGWENPQLAPAGLAPSRNGRDAHLAAVLARRERES